jgi:hypothetical protein
MPRYTTVVSTITPKAYDILTKFIEVKRTDTTAFMGIQLPKYAVIIGMYVLGQAASDAATTATVSIGTTSANSNEILNAFDVKGTTGLGYNPAANKLVGTYAGHKLTADTQIWAKYAESGTASTTGGPWIVKVDYTIPGPGEQFDL